MPNPDQLEADPAGSPARAGADEATGAVTPAADARGRPAHGLGAQLRSTLETISLLGVVLDCDGCVVFINDFALDLLGWPREQVLEHEWFSLVMAPEMAEAMRDVYLGAINTGGLPTHFEVEVLTRAGEARLVDWNNTMLYEADGEVSGVASIGQDITERRLAEEAQAAATAALRESDERLRRVLSGVDAIIAFQAHKGAPLYQTEALEPVLGRSPDAVNSLE
jgi:PAS domain S-box-containing protein